MKPSAQTAGIVTLVGAGIAAVGTLLPYVEAIGPFGIDVSRAGVQTDGIFVLILSAVPAIVAGSVFLRREPGPGAVVIAVLGSMAVIAATIAVWFEIANSGAKLPDLDVQSGVGLYVSLIGGVLAFAGCLMAAPLVRYADAAPAVEALPKP